MLDLNIHNVASIEIQEIKRHGGDADYSFGTRKLVIMDEKGQRVELTLFSDDLESLKAKVSTSAITLDV
jgi:hypothetical protein